jgi:hypothetical protein
MFTLGMQPKQTHFEVGFLGGFFGFYWAGFLLPTLLSGLTGYPAGQSGIRPDTGY